MSLRRPPPATRRRLVWLLWLALLLPLAQALSLGHGLSHVVQAAGTGDDGKAAPHALHCDLCLAAQAVTGGAPPADAPGLLPGTAVHVAPRAAADSVAPAPLALAYRSRAPPPTPA